MLGDLLEVVAKLDEFRDKFQQTGERRRERIASYFSEIAKCLGEAAEKLENGKVPSTEWGELKIYAEKLPEAIGEEIGQEQVSDLSYLLKRTINNTSISEVAKDFKGKGKGDIQAIREASGRFNGLATTVQAATRLKGRNSRHLRTGFSKRVLTKLLILGLGVVGVIGTDWWLTSSAYKNCSDLPLHKTFDMDFLFYRSIVTDAHKELGRSCTGSYLNNSKQGTEKLLIAMNAFEKAESLRPDDPQTHFFLGHIREILAGSSGKEPEYADSDEQYNKATQLYLEKIKYGGHGIGRQDSEVLVELGHFLGTHQRDDDALRLYEQVLKQDQDNTGALLGICVTHFHLNTRSKLEETLRICERAIQNLKDDKSKGGRRAKLEKNLAEAYYDLGCVQVRLGDYSRATKSFNDGSLREAPEMDKYLDSAKFFSLILDEKYLEAIEFLQSSKLLNEVKHDSSKEKGEQEETHEHKGSEDVNQEGSFNFGLGIANFALGNYDEAIEHFNRATSSELTQHYLSKARECKESGLCQKWTHRGDPRIIAEIHNRFSAFVVHYYKIDSLLVNPHHNHNEKTSRSCALASS
jgi:tetratricopeptide (TPR) repeat protein